MRPWESLIKPDEIDIYKKAGFLGVVKFGKRPALLVIDVQYNFTGDYPEPISIATDKYRLSCGENAWRSIPYIRELIDLARQRSIPVIYTKDWELPEPPTECEAARGTEIIKEIAPLPGEMVIEKGAASGFSGTRLISYLISLEIDTLIVTGTSTSGCVRATVMDAYDYRYKTFVVEECVFDRANTPHRASLFDMAAKAANVVSIAEMSRLLEEFSAERPMDAIRDSPSFRSRRR